MQMYNLWLTKNELKELNDRGRVQIEDEIEIGCDNCNEDINLEIQILIKDD